MEIKLRQIREKKGFSQEQMAEYLKISQSQYYRKERGTSKIQEKEWDILAKSLDVNKTELRDKNWVSPFNNHTEDGGIYSSHIMYVSEQLVSELKEHVLTLKEKNTLLKEQYEFRIKEKDKMIDFLKQNNSVQS
ncbi:helix-turn-helix domain-containing protein [Flavobacterium gawalongense]|uniref:Helix-turn-helix transcriptional regulator n=2 Tax=Flavobacterium gawalongense TaxID=2594432 RepID=A0A553BN51_9FLAO|nr:helix-turn-helix transcriptional regulator [Flavobacterium gawalongense]TRX00157.1 helix-turn-helix transcriptional regulator [Flavobacterium gawalongense]TRX04905.1 helix-turn-helix transcriptional regulator [Flavobacterium gawalongense]TRX09683.1 helix-turn-helix transcriptional regulator [Flavobacterium gawalongense]TRX10833.1 helix-turn-helix transcriptional regulator [Flavobacterium gawalongense]TRX28088.1 helix-turn-helix transcriptional regulator [Flavobacterium gawalongense]